MHSSEDLYLADDTDFIPAEAFVGRYELKRVHLNNPDCQVDPNCLHESSHPLIFDWIKFKQGLKGFMQALELYTTSYHYGIQAKVFLTVKGLACTLRYQSLNIPIILPLVIASSSFTGFIQMVLDNDPKYIEQYIPPRREFYLQGKLIWSGNEYINISLNEKQIDISKPGLFQLQGYPLLLLSDGYDVQVMLGDENAPIPPNWGNLVVKHYMREEV